MTKADKNAIWRSLPESVKEEICCDYSKALQAHSFDPNNPRIDAHIKFLEAYFGKSNLTSASDSKPGVKVGDQVLLSPLAPLNNLKGFVVSFTLYPSCIEEIEGNRARITQKRVEMTDVPLEYLIPYADEQVPPIIPEVDDCNHMDNIRPMCDDNIWLSYRMELAKDIAVNLARKSNDAPAVIKRTMAIVDGIVDRLKAGEND